MTYKRINNLTGWAVFAVAAYTFLSTIEPTASFWDCGEYIATSYKLQVGHPPGAPLFQMIGRVFTLFAGNDVTKAAKMVNIMSALSSAFAILFLFWTITALAKKLVIFKMSKGEDAENPAAVSGDVIPMAKIWAIMGAGAVGALAYTFTDSFWFSAVEGEVYAMSQMCTAIVFWAILKWEEVADQPKADRWLVLIAYLFGLSIGVHLLNLLTIPSIVFIYYFKKYKKITPKGFIIALLASVAILGLILSVIVPGVINLSGNFEIFFVNKFGLPFNGGSAIFFALLIGIIFTGLKYTHKPEQKTFNVLMGLSGLFYLISLITGATIGNGSALGLRVVLGGAALAALYFYRARVQAIQIIILSFTMLVIGYSSFMMLVIRSNANTPMNENAPKDAVGLLAYLGREQYGDWPILYGQYYNAPQDPQKPYTDGNPVYMRTPKVNPTDKDEYFVADDRVSSIPNYDPNYCTIFPRMWNSEPSHVSAYKTWGGIKRNDMVDPNTGEKIPVKPTFGENLQYFISYQMGWMYWRYFFWNFSGRQNDMQGHGNAIDGNWITGFKAFDEARLGVSGVPESYKHNKGTNAFYFLPVILGLIGFLYQANKYNKDAFVVLLLFLFTGLAIIVYLNQYPYQPRERDYAYAGSFYAFSIWIGFAVLAIFDFLSSKLNQKASAAVATLVGLLGAPTLLAKDGWDDHDRSNRYTARDIAKDYLNSCAPNAILFTNGDNDTFPLWYVQEVEGYRTDVRVCNLSLFNTDWYINSMKRKAYDSEPLPLTLTEDKYRQGTRDYLPFYDRKVVGYIPVKELVDFMISEDPQAKLQMQNGKGINYFPTKHILIPVDSASVLANGTVSKADAGRIEHGINWDLNKSYVLKNEIMVLDMLAHNDWKRPIYFAVSAGAESYMNLQPWFQLEGLTYRLVPVRSTQEEMQTYGSHIATDIMYNNIKKFEWGGMDQKGVYLDENISRLVVNLRIQMANLASALVKEGKKDKAIEIADLCLQKMPDENMPFDAYNYSLVSTYYTAGANEKANKLAKRLFDIYEGNLNFYLRMQPAKAAAHGSDVRRAKSIMEGLSMMAHEFKQDALAKEFETRCAPFVQVGGNAGQQQQEMIPEEQ